MAECPEEFGLPAERLERIRRILRQDVERRLIPGAVMLIDRAGRIGFVEATGFRDRGAGVMMTLDAIFRIASKDPLPVFLHADHRPGPRLRLAHERQVERADPGVRQAARSVVGIFRSRIVVMNQHLQPRAVVRARPLHRLGRRRPRTVARIDEMIGNRQQGSKRGVWKHIWLRRQGLVVPYPSAPTFQLPIAGTHE